jgi:hypothetical protein
MTVMTDTHTRPDSNEIERVALDDIVTRLQPYIERWGLPTKAARRDARLRATIEELDAFYGVAAPMLEGIIQALNGYALESIPAQYFGLAYLAFSLCEIDMAVNHWRAPRLSPAKDHRVIFDKHHVYDNNLSQNLEWAWRDEVEKRVSDQVLCLI